jgi:hypothetical protein
MVLQFTSFTLGSVAYYIIEKLLPFDARRVVTMAGDQANGQIPIVDFAQWKPDSLPEQRLKVAQDLVSACRSVGFVYIINHDVPKETLDKAFEITKKLYDLPQEEKMKAPHPPGWAHHRGYSWPGLEKVSAALSEKDDEKMVEQLREVTDCKVWLLTSTSAIPSTTIVDVPYRKATKLGPTRTLTSPISGCHCRPSRNFDRS